MDIEVFADRYAEELALLEELNALRAEEETHSEPDPYSPNRPWEEVEEEYPF